MDISAVENVTNVGIFTFGSMFVLLLVITAGTYLEKKWGTDDELRTADQRNSTRSDSRRNSNSAV